MKLAWILALLLFAVVGCSHAGSSANVGKYVKPSVAVMKFENRTAFPMHWDLGGGTRDILVDRLMRSGRYHVIERPELNEVLKELNFQQSGMTRPQDKAALGKIKNVQYLIKGTVTEFAQVSGVSAGAAKKGAFGIFGSDNQAIVAIVLYVVDVQSGEILACESIEERVHASNVSVQAAYKDIGFGGSAFYDTPLGEAMAKVIDRAVAKITQSIASEQWQPRIAELRPDGRVLLSGGADHGIVLGEQFSVTEDGPAVIDPTTGDVLGHQGSRAVGTIQVVHVFEHYSEAASVSPSPAMKVGQVCKKLAN